MPLRFALRVRPDFAGQQTVLGQHFFWSWWSYGEELHTDCSVGLQRKDASRPINWLEYEKDPSCQPYQDSLIALVPGEGQIKRSFSEEEMEQTARIDGATLLPSLSLESKREKRYDRVRHALVTWSLERYPLRRHGDHKRQEISLISILAIWSHLKHLFSARRRFEGFGMMRAMGSPFILFLTQDRKVDPSIWAQKNGKVKSLPLLIFQAILDLAGFWAYEDMNFSGLSMGTFLSSYWCSLFSSCVILGRKPVNLGDVAANPKQRVQMSSEITLDMMLIIGQGHQKESASSINAWGSALDQADFKDAISCLWGMMTTTSRLIQIF